MRSSKSRKGKEQFNSFPFSLLMVGARGFEPPTSRSRTVRATRLRYAPLRQSLSLGEQVALVNLCSLKLVLLPMTLRPCVRDEP